MGLVEALNKDSLLRFGFVGTGESIDLTALERRLTRQVLRMWMVEGIFRNSGDGVSKLTCAPG